MGEIRVEIGDRTTVNTVFVEVFVKYPKYQIENEEYGGWERIHVSEEDLDEPSQIELSFGG